MQPTELLDRRPRTTEVHGADDRPQPTWLPWTGATRPATTAEEARFVAALRAAADATVDAHTRADTTAVLNALRGGLALDDLLGFAPGLQPARLDAAYRQLDARRQTACEAWEAIVAAGTVAALVEHASEAALVVPSLVDRLVGVAARSPGSVGEMAHRLQLDVEAQRRHVARIEAVLDSPDAPDQWTAELGRLLYDPFGEAIANRPDHLPDRVGLLSPVRVAALLGESARPAPSVPSGAGAP